MVGRRPPIINCINANPRSPPNSVYAFLQWNSSSTLYIFGNTDFLSRLNLVGQKVKRMVKLLHFDRFLTALFHSVWLKGTGRLATATSVNGISRVRTLLGGSYHFFWQVLPLYWGELPLFLGILPLFWPKPNVIWSKSYSTPRMLAGWGTRFGKESARFHFV